MHDALIRISDIKKLDTRLVGSVPRRDNKIATTGHQRVVTPSRARINNVVHGAERVFTPTHGSLALQQPVQRHTACPFMQKNTVDIKQGLTL